MENPRAPIRLMLVDDSELVRCGLRAVLATHSDRGFRIVAEAGNVAEAVNKAAKHQPDIILLDIRLPDGTGFDACRQILQQRPDTRVIVLTAFSNDDYVYQAVTSGAQGYLMKEIPPAALVQAILDVADGRSILDPEATSRVLRLLRSGGEQGPNLSVLSVQERRVLALVADGLTNKQVGEQLNLSENTVKNYLVSVFDKLQVKRRAQAAALYVQQTSPTARGSG